MGMLSRIGELLAAVRREEVERLAPAERRRLADLCRHVAAMAEPAPAPRPGVLSELKDGSRAE